MGPKNNSENDNQTYRFVLSLDLTYKQIQEIEDAKESLRFDMLNPKMYNLVFLPLSHQIASRTGRKSTSFCWVDQLKNEFNEAHVQYTQIPIFSLKEKILGKFGSEKRFNYKFSVILNFNHVLLKTNGNLTQPEEVMKRRNSFYLIQGGK